MCLGCLCVRGEERESCPLRSQVLRTPSLLPHSSAVLPGPLCAQPAAPLSTVLPGPPCTQPAAPFAWAAGKPTFRAVAARCSLFPLPHPPALVSGNGVLTCTLLSGWLSPSPCHRGHGCCCLPSSLPLLAMRWVLWLRLRGLQELPIPCWDCLPHSPPSPPWNGDVVQAGGPKRPISPGRAGPQGWVSPPTSDLWVYIYYLCTPGQTRGTLTCMLPCPQTLCQ